VDATRIGVDGKSFGGYLTLYALIHAPDVFRCGVAGAAPTDWTYYDTIYTERYMRTPQENPKGYAATNLIAKVDQLKAAPLLIHGLADTNVHLQNTVNFIQALEAADKPFDFIPLPNLSHSFRGDGLVAALSASVDYLTACLAAAPVATTETVSNPPGIANPASENCIKQGGTLSIKERGDGGQYGICFFEDNRQCEEWAMFRGECPVGGIKVTGYVTPAARYCAITGGQYAITANSNTENEQGTCTFKNGAQCDAWDYFNGKCDPSTGAAVPAVTAAARVPLKNAIASIEPQDVWQNFRSDADSAAFASF
jgi:putative hemolysin